MVAQYFEYTKKKTNTELYSLKGFKWWILCTLNFLSQKILEKKQKDKWVMNHFILFSNHLLSHILSLLVIQSPISQHFILNEKFIQSQIKSDL